MKIDIDDLPIDQNELLRIRSKIETFADVAGLSPKHKLQFIDNYSHEHWYKCVDPFSIHKQLVKMNSHDVALTEFHSIFSTYNVLRGQQVCMKCFKTAKDVPASTIIIENEVEMNEKVKISVKTTLKLANKSLELFDCSPIKTVKPDRTLQIGKMKISKVTMPLAKQLQ